MTDERLVVAADDNDDIRRLLERRLGRRGWRVMAAADGAAALELVRAHGPDAVVLDVTMPRMTGREVLDALRADASTEALPIVLLSARVEADERESALAAGADAYLGKPFDVGELDATLRGLVDARGHRTDTTE